MRASASKAFGLSATRHTTRDAPEEPRTADERREEEGSEDRDRHASFIRHGRSTARARATAQRQILRTETWRDRRGPSTMMQPLSPKSVTRPRAIRAFLNMM